MKLILVIAAVALGAGLSSGCSTPQPVKDAAAVTTEMMEQLEAETQKFKVAREAGDASILRHTAVSKKTHATITAGIAERLADEQAGGNVKVLDLYSRMKAASIALKDSDAALAAEKARIDAEMDGLLEPLPDVSTPLNNALSAVAALARERSTKDQFEEALAVFKAVEKSTKDNREKLKKAVAAAP